jgi:hypothetical protein
MSYNFQECENCNEYKLTARVIIEEYYLDYEDSEVYEYCKECCIEKGLCFDCKTDNCKCNRFEYCNECKDFKPSKLIYSTRYIYCEDCSVKNEYCFECTSKINECECDE